MDYLALQWCGMAVPASTSAFSPHAQSSAAGRRHQPSPCLPCEMLPRLHHQWTFHLRCRILNHEHLLALRIGSRSSKVCKLKSVSDQQIRLLLPRQLTYNCARRPSWWQQLRMYWFESSEVKRIYTHIGIGMMAQVYFST